MRGLRDALVRFGACWRARGVALVRLSFALCLLLSANARAAEIDRSTPRLSMVTLLELCQEEDYARAAQGFDLRAPSPATRKTTPAELAMQLCRIVERAVVIDLEVLSNDAEGNPEDGKLERVAQIQLGQKQVILQLTRVNKNWLLTSTTISHIPDLYDRFGPTWLEEKIPEHLASPRLGALAIWQWVGLCGALLSAVLGGGVLNWIVQALGRRIARRTKVTWDDKAVVRLRRPSLLFLMLLSFRGLLELFALPAATMGVLDAFLKSLFILGVAWVILAIGGLVADDIEARAARAAKTQSRELKARGVRTQVQVLRRVLSIAVVIVAMALMLTQFEVLRSVGVSLLASAGVAGIVLGLAAQRTIGNLIAGIQLSVTQPVRIGDDVVIEGELGVIEEITLTYVIVKIWDERRLLVPMAHFFDKPFENWTKISSPLHGTVFLTVHPALPVDALRAELDRLLEDHPLWDHRTKRVQVTDSSERGMIVRVLVSAQSSGVLFTLRHELREKLLSWLANYEGGRYLVLLDELPRPLSPRPPLVAAPEPIEHTS